MYTKNKASKYAQNLEKLFKGQTIAFEEDDKVIGQYPGEYLSNACRILTELADIEDIAITITEFRMFWNDKDSTIINQMQRYSVLSWLEPYKDQSTIISACLYLLYKADKENSTELLKKWELYTRLMAEIEFDIKNINNFSEILKILSICPAWAKIYNPNIETFLKTVNVYEDFDEISGLLQLMNSPEWNLKNKLLNNMKKLMSSNITETSNAYKILNVVFTKSQICFLNARLIHVSGGMASRDKVYIAFFRNLLKQKCINQKYNITEQEEELMRRLYPRSFTHKVESFSLLSSYVYNCFIVTHEPMQNSHNWKAIYRCLSTYGSVNIDQNHLLHFYIYMNDPINTEKWLMLSDSEKAYMINSEAKHAIITEAEDEKTVLKECLNVCKNTWGTKTVRLLVEEEAYDAISAFLKHNLIPITEDLEGWVNYKSVFRSRFKGLTERELEAILVYCKKYDFLPSALEITDAFDFLDCLCLEKSTKYSQDIRHSLFDLCLETCYCKTPILLIPVMKKLFAQSVDKEGEGNVPLLPYFMFDDDIKYYAQMLYNSKIIDNIDVKRFIMTKKEYEEYIRKESEKKEAQNNKNMLLDAQQKIEKELKSFIKFDCNIKYKDYLKPSSTKTFEEDVLSDVIPHIAIQYFNEQFNEQLNIAHAADEERNGLKITKVDAINIYIERMTSIANLMQRESYLFLMAQNILQLEGN